MAADKTAWGIEIGSQALKAIRLERQGTQAQIIDFSYVPYKKTLSTPGLDADEMIRLAIGQFVSQRPDLDDGAVVVSVPGNAAFARFAKLPPVEPKKVPDIVKFEAVQQIPFPIDEVEWDYQTFECKDSPEVEVGIFALTKASIATRLGLYREIGLYPDGITLSPVAAYNALNYDMDLDQDKNGTIILDIGSTSTDLIICKGGSTWIRTFPIGGHTFTETLINLFKLTYSKAEKLKAEAQTSKYRRQILNALRPVFSDLAQDVQRSIGYYQSTHTDVNLTKLVGVGSTFKLPGLRKFLSQHLQMEIVRLDEFNKIKPSTRNMEQFSSHTLNYATAYGLALQGVGLGQIDVNLIPITVVRERLWGRKIKWFGAAAALVVFGSLLSLTRPALDSKYKNQPAKYKTPINNTIAKAKGYQARFNEIKSATEVDGRAQNITKMLNYRDVWQYIISDVSQILSSGNPQPELYSSDMDVIASIDPGERRIMEMVSLTHKYAPPGDGDSKMPKVRLELTLETPHKDRHSFVNKYALGWLRDNAERQGVPYKIVGNLKLENRIILRTAGAENSDIDRSSGRSSPRNSRTTGRSKGGRGVSEFSGGEFGGGEFGGGEFGGGEFGGGKSGRSGSRTGYASNRNIESLAPLPEPVPYLPPDTEYYRMTIIWEIELLPAHMGIDNEADTNKEVKG